jgi:integrase/recombinase XerD
MKQAKTLTPQELRQAMGQAALSRHAARDKAMLLLTHLAGMRVGEVAALKVGDVLDTEGSIRGELRLTPEQTKGNSSRIVFVNERLQKELAAYSRIVRGNNPSTPFFVTQKRTGFSANTLTQHFITLYRRAGLDGATSHSGRRTFITNLASQGVSVRVLAALAGHRSIQTTQRYIDVNDDMLRKAVELV